jgi:hypothetical protein
MNRTWLRSPLDNFLSQTCAGNELPSGEKKEVIKLMKKWFLGFALAALGVAASGVSVLADTIGGGW